MSAIQVLDRIAFGTTVIAALVSAVAGATGNAVVAVISGGVQR
jgi:hypothetical protein